MKCVNVIIKDILLGMHFTWWCIKVMYNNSQCTWNLQFIDFIFYNWQFMPTVEIENFKRFSKSWNETFEIYRIITRKTSSAWQTLVDIDNRGEFGIRCHCGAGTRQSIYSFNIWLVSLYCHFTSNSNRISTATNIVF